MTYERFAKSFRGDHGFLGRSTLPVKRHKGDMGSNRDSEAKEIAAEEGITVTYCPVCGDFLFNGQHRAMSSDGTVNCARRKGKQMTVTDTHEKSRWMTRAEVH
jgi:hypothetical protein